MRFRRLLGEVVEALVIAASTCAFEGEWRLCAQCPSFKHRIGPAPAPRL